MNNRQNGRRRGRGGGPRPNGQGGGVDRGNRIDNRARGNANQLYEKYKTLARDAQTQGDRVMTEYYLQFADHYFRVLSESRARFEDQRPRREEQAERDFGDDFIDEPEGIAGLATEARRAPPPVQAAAEEEVAPEPAQPRWSEPASNGHAATEEAEEQPRRPRRGRPPRREAAEAPAAPKAEERIEIDRLPPALSAGSGEEEAPRPKRRGRPPKVAQVEA